MRVVLNLVLGFLVWVGLTASAAEKRERLTDHHLAAITAGDTEIVAGGGAVVVGNSSTAELQLSNVVELQASSQQHAAGLQLVNAAQSDIGNGLNVWDASSGQRASAAEFILGQSNFALQDQRASSRVDEWKLAGPNVREAFTQSRSITFTGEVLTGFTLERTLVVDGNVEEASETTIPGGAGFAAAGTFAIEFGAGSVDISSVITATTVTTTETCFNFIFVEFCRSGESTTTLTETVGGSTSFEGFSMQVTNGSACFAVVGTCSAEASVSTSLSGERTVLLPGRMKGAEAEHIAMSDGRLELQKDSAVLLASRAQQSVRALNGINAASSAVSSGVNVVRSALRGVVLNQLNAIVQYQ
jgi:hypothetical protein